MSSMLSDSKMRRVQILEGWKNAEEFGSSDTFVSANERQGQSAVNHFISRCLVFRVEIEGFDHFIFDRIRWQM